MGLISDVFGGGDAKKAARASQQGFQAAEETFRNAKTNFAPFLGAGQTASNQLLQLLNGDTSSFQTSPGFQFAVDQGNKLVENSAAARGMTFSGSQLKDLARFGQGIANQEFQNNFNNLLNVSNLGLSAGNSNLSAAGGIAGAQTGGADARASGFLANAGIKGGIANSLLDFGLSRVGGG